MSPECPGAAEAGGEQVAANEPRIYVASLSDYNAGVLHGRWMTADQAVEEMQAAVAEMLTASAQPGAEEWAIHDYTGFGALELSEYESLEVVSRLARGIIEHGPGFAAWAALGGRGEASLALFEEAYLGQWDCLEDYAASLLDDLGASEALERVPSWLQPYVKLDVARFSRDLRLGGAVQMVNDGGKVFVFDGTV